MRLVLLSALLLAPLCTVKSDEGPKPEADKVQQGRLEAWGRILESAENAWWRYQPGVHDTMHHIDHWSMDPELTEAFYGLQRAGEAASPIVRVMLASPRPVSRVWGCYLSGPWSKIPAEALAPLLEDLATAHTWRNGECKETTVGDEALEALKRKIGRAHV